MMVISTVINKQGGTNPIERERARNPLSVVVLSFNGIGNKCGRVTNADSLKTEKGNVNK